MKCCELYAGKLRNKITIEREVSTNDGLGGTTVQWVKAVTLPAYIKPMTGSERFAAQRLEARTTHRIFIRYRADLTTTDRVVFEGRKMQIRAIIDVEERKRWIEIHAEEGVAT